MRFLVDCVCHIMEGFDKCRIAELEAKLVNVALEIEKAKAQLVPALTVPELELDATTIALPVALPLDDHCGDYYHSAEGQAPELLADGDVPDEMLQKFMDTGDFNNTVELVKALGVY